MSLHQIMNISRESMMNNQYALTVVSHNVANLNTVGYSKQRVNFQEDRMNTSGSISAVIRGLNGATISGIQSYANSAINTAVRNANGNSSYYAALGSMLGDLDGITDELGETGLQKSFGDFFTAAQNLSKDPTDATYRREYMQMAKNIAYKFNTMYTALENQKMEIAGDWTKPSTVQTSNIGLMVEDINGKLEQIANLNKEIASVGTNQGAANSLIDQRNLVLDQLSSMVPLNVVENSSGTVTVSLNNMTLVEGYDVVQKLNATAGTSDDKPIVIQLENVKTGIVGKDVTSEFGASGQLGAMIDMVSTKDGVISINTFMEKLDILARDFSKTINEMQTYSNGDEKACYITKSPVDGSLILAYDPPPPDMFEGTGAKDLKVTDAIVADPNLITAAKVNTDATTNTNWWLNVGNGQNVLEIAELRSKNVVDSTGLGGLPDATLEGFLTSLIAKVGVQGADVAAKAKTLGNTTSIYATERQSLVGVNLDEELADMIKYQRSYEASARMFTASNEILQVLVNLGR